MVCRASEDFEEAYLGIIGSFNFFVGVFHRPERQAHVRLAATQPYIAYEHVVQFNRLFAAYLDRVWTAGRRRIDLDLPAAIFPGRAGCGLFADFDAYFISWIGPTPNCVGLASLQNHVVAEDGGDEWQLPWNGWRRWKGRGSSGRRRLGKCAVFRR